MKRVYLDHAATTPIDASVLSSMLPYLKQNFNNPSALYSGGVEANKAIKNARAQISEILGTEPDTIYFTSGGTESNNAAILGIARQHQKFGKHIITTQIEHHAALEPLKHLEENGFEVTYLKPNQDGLVTPEQVFLAIRHDTIFVSVMYANNEIGTILPIHDIGRTILRYRKENKTSYPYFFTDACQAAGYLDLHVESLHVDALALNASKIYGPKGSAILYVRRGVKLEPLMFGGSQESKLRPGTENVAGAIGLASALTRTEKIKQKESARLSTLSSFFANELRKKIPTAVLNGPSIGSFRLPNNINISIPGIEAETTVLYLDKEGVQCSTGSACTAISSTPSHVLEAIGKSKDEIKSSLRFTLGRTTTKKDLEYAVKSLKKVVELLAYQTVQK